MFQNWSLASRFSTGPHTGLAVQSPDSVLSRWPVLPIPLQSAPEPRSSLHSVILLSCLFPGPSVSYPYRQDSPQIPSQQPQQALQCPSFSQLLLWPCSTPWVDGLLTVLSHMVSGSCQSMTPTAGVQQSGPGGSAQQTESSQLCSFVYTLKSGVSIPFLLITVFKQLFGYLGAYTHSRSRDM